MFLAKKDAIAAGHLSIEQMEEVLGKKIETPLAAGGPDRHVTPMSDILITDACAYGYQAWVYPTGSKFIEAIDEKFRKNWEHHNIEYILKLVRIELNFKLLCFQYSK